MSIPLSAIDELQLLPPLHQAAYLGDVDRIQAAINAGTPVDLRVDYDGVRYYRQITPLMIAAASPNDALAALRLLLKLGADLHAKSAMGATALWYAAYSDSSRVQLLLDAGSDPNNTTHNGPYISDSMLGIAAASGNIESVQLLLKAGASPHRPVADANALVWYHIPLFQAAKGGSAACVEAIVAAGSDFTINTWRNCTALFDASTAEVVNSLVKLGCPLNYFDQAERTELDSAFENGEEEVVRALVSAGSSLEMPNKYGDPVLFRYCLSFDVEAENVQLLIDLGANVQTRVRHGRTALHYTVSSTFYGRSERLGAIVRVLVAAGIPVDVRDDDDYTPLQVAVGGWDELREDALDNRGGSETAVQALIDLGAAIEATDAKGRTPLIIAAKNNSSLVPLLIAAGANVHQVTNDGYRAFDYAFQKVQSWENITANPRVEATEAHKILYEQALAEARSVFKMLQDATEADKNI
jgi:ankyrin repeat-rich membrane spanning protein